MRLEMLASSVGETWLMGVLLLLGAAFLLFGKKGEFIVVGMVVIGGIVSIAYTNHSAYLQERYTMQRFHEGRALICGLWRGENVRVDPKSGWSKEEGVGFVKGDMIVNDIGVCRIIGEKTPEPSGILYWMVLVGILVILLTLRGVTLGVKEEDHDTRAE
ncbi:MAG: hypothetical protein PHW64_03305 [Sulfuricurvum sp.]|nr:hypothetical protein [Sulfuricurvum sp.]